MSPQKDKYLVRCAPRTRLLGCKDGVKSLCWKMVLTCLLKSHISFVMLLVFSLQSSRGFGPTWFAVFAPLPRGTRPIWHGIPWCLPPRTGTWACTRQKTKQNNSVHPSRWKSPMKCKLHQRHSNRNNRRFDWPLIKCERCIFFFFFRVVNYCGCCVAKSANYGSWYDWPVFNVWGRRLRFFSILDELAIYNHDMQVSHCRRSWKSFHAENTYYP